MPRLTITLTMSQDLSDALEEYRTQGPFQIDAGPLYATVSDLVEDQGIRPLLEIAVDQHPKGSLLIKQNQRDTAAANYRAAKKNALTYASIFYFIIGVV